MNNEKSGTIRSKEAKQVVYDLLLSRGVSKAVWKITPGGELHMLVANRSVTFPLKAGMTYYGLRNMLQQIERCLDEMAVARDRRQIDLEDAIRTVSA